jgi:ABC-type dipeptide/oligopeptide/nickel transport system permease subunit
MAKAVVIPSVNAPGIDAPALRRRPAIRILAYPQLVIGCAVLALLLFGAIFGPAVVGYGPTDADFSAAMTGPSAAHVLGTDQLGRDSLSRALSGARISLFVAVGTVILSMGAGVPLGLVSGLRRGWIESLIMRAMDGVLAFPGLILAMAIAFVLGPSIPTVIIALAVVRVPPFARVVRSQALTLGESGFVESARAVGVGPARIALRHVLPNIFSTILVQASLTAGAAIFTEASLSFLGAGIPPPTPTWGGMLHDAYPYLEVNPWQTFVPGICIFLAVLSCNFIGEGFRDLLDPRERTRRGATHR